MRGPTPETSIRVNRVSGPFGHLAEGTRFSQARAQVSSARPLSTCVHVHPPPPPLPSQRCSPLAPLSSGVRSSDHRRHTSAGGGDDLRAAADSRRRADSDCALLHVHARRHEREGCRPAPPRHPTLGVGGEREAVVVRAAQAPPRHSLAQPDACLHVHDIRRGAAAARSCRGEARSHFEHHGGEHDALELPDQPEQLLVATVDCTQGYPQPLDFAVYQGVRTPHSHEHSLPLRARSRTSA